MGRPWPQPGEPLFLEDDTAAVIALAEEERDTCPSCGFPKAWCRGDENKGAFDLNEDICWATWRLSLRRQSDAWKGLDEAAKQASQLSPRIRKDRLPRLDAGLDFD